MKNAIIKCLLFWILFDALLFGLGHLAALAPPGWSRLLQGLLGTLAGFALIRLFLKSEKRAFSDIGLVWDRSTLIKFLLGILVGIALFTVVLFILLNFTGLELKRSSNGINVQAWLISFIVILPLAFMEELVFRSYTLLKLEKAYGLLWAQIMVAIPFALYHVVGGWSWQVAFLGPFVWAFVFGLAAIWSRGIALPTGIHAALNFLQVLAGMKAGKASFWTLELKQKSADASVMANRVGIGVQILILIAGIIVTYLFVRNKKLSPTPVKRK
jgi:membrane protease YdiL (CAAX protease family)